MRGAKKECFNCKWLSSQAKLIVAIDEVWPFDKRKARSLLRTAILMIKKKELKNQIIIILEHSNIVFRSATLC